MQLITDLKALSGGTKRQQRLYRKALQAAVVAVNSDQFKYSVLDFSYTDSNGLKFDNFKRNHSYPWMQFSQQDETVNDNLSNQDIYDVLMSGWDMYSKEKDGDIDVETALYRNRFSSTVGYTYGNTLKTWSNTKFWIGDEKQIIAIIAANIIHEYMHNLGFGHAVKWNTTRDYTVPYAIGNMVYHLIMESEIFDHVIMEPIEYDRVQLCYRPWYFLWLKEVCTFKGVQSN